MFLLLPIAIIIPSSFNASQYIAFPPSGLSLQWYQRLVERPEWGRAFATSVSVASLCTLITVGLGVPAALALVRGRFPAKELAYGLILSPMILPHIIIALGTYFFFTTIGLSGSVLGIAIAHAITVVPVVVVMVSASLQSIDPRLEQAAVLFGASPAQAFLKITLPLMGPGIISASLFAFLLSFDELIIALFISNPRTTTLPIRIWNETVYQISPTISAVSTLLILLSGLILAAALAARGRGKRL
jgi:putative spermidine/putrescine transport system permease protein